MIFDTDEICSEKVSDESKITPRLCAEFIWSRYGHRSIGLGSVNSHWVGYI